MANQLQFWPEPRPRPRLRWSISRDKRLRDCARKYYLYHYASAGGRRAPEATPEREAYILKHLRNRYMWVGEVVHELIELTLNAWRRGQHVPVDAVVDRGTRRMRADYVQSLQGVYREKPAEACGLVEHEYQEPIPRAEWQAQRDKMERCVRHFFALPVTQVIRETPSWRWLALEAMASFELDGATILVKPDFAWREADGRVMLVDWKTGQPYADEHAQLAVYGMYAERVWGLNARGMEAQLVYLSSGTVETVPLDGEAMGAAEQGILGSVGEMRRLGVEEPDVELFAQTEDRDVCSRCAFRRLCER